MNEKKPMADQSVLWGHPIAFWDVWGVRTMIGGAILGFVALAVTLFSSYVLYRVADMAQDKLAERTGSMDVRLGEQAVEIERQKSIAADAIARAEQAREGAANAELEL